MRAVDLHRQAREPAAEPPDKLTVKDLNSLSERARVEYLRVRKNWLLNLRHDGAPLRQVRTQLADICEENEFSGPGAKQIAVVDAVNTIGKSTTVRRWARETYQAWAGERLESPDLPTWSPTPGVRAVEVPIVWVNLQSTSQIKDANAQVLDFLDYPTEGMVRSLTTRIVAAVARHNVRTLIVDDVHWLSQSDQNRDGLSHTGQEVLNHLKHLNTELGERGATLVLIGARMDNTGILADPQISGRARVLRMREFGADTHEERLAWQAFLDEVETRLLPYLPAASPGLLSRQLVTHIWRRTQGYIGDTSRLISAAAIRAGIDGSWTIRREHLAGVPLSERAAIAEGALTHQRINAAPRAEGAS